MNVTEFVINALQKKYTIDPSVDLQTLNYIENGYVDSMGMIQFVLQLEETFGIEFTDEEVASPAFQIVGELIALVERKRLGKV